MFNNLIKIGIVGCGWIAQNAYIPTFVKKEDVVINSIFDCNVESLRKVKELYGIKNIFTDYNLFLKSDIDAVVICTPNYTHKSYSVLALKADKHVLCEKPTALNYFEMLEINREVKEENLIFVPAFVNRFRTDVVKLKSILKKYNFEKIKKITGVWERQNGIPRPGSWFTDKSLSGGGALIDIGTHMVDICLSLSGSQDPIKQLRKTKLDYSSLLTEKASWFSSKNEMHTKISVESSAKGSLLLRDNIEMEINVGWNSSKSKDYTLVRIETKNGYLQLNTLFGFSPNKRWHNSKITWEIVGLKNEEYTFSNIDPIYAFEKLCDYFCGCIRSKNTKELSISEGLKVVKAVDLLYGSDACG